MPKHNYYLEISGTFLQGFTEPTTRRELTALFGEPTHREEGDKVTIEWSLDFGGGNIATIYDWKRYELGAPRQDEKMVYHIGGFSRVIVEKVKQELGKVSA